MTDLIPSADNNLPRTLVEHAAYFGGTYRSGYAVHKNAAVSLLRAAAMATHQLLQTLERIKGRKTSPAETAFLLNANYDLSLCGPAIAATLFPAIALEGFAITGYQIALETNRPKKKRAEGYDQVLLSKLDDFQTKPLTRRLNILAAAVGARSIPEGDPRSVAVQDLIAFRNSCVHETPTLVTRELKSLRYAKRNARDADQLRGYLDLGNNIRPARLVHALRAVSTHDDMVHELMSTSSSEWSGLIRRIDARARGHITIRKMYGSADAWRNLRELSKTWERIGEEAADCTVSEQEDFVSALKRRREVRLVE